MKKAAILIVIGMLILPPFAFAQQAMSSATYKIESDSVNSGGVRSASGSYGVEDTAGEVSTGRSKSSNFGLFEAGYQGMRTNIAAPTNVPPTTPTGLAATAVSSSAVDLTWSASTDDYAVAGYSIYRGGVKVASLSEFPREYLDTGLSAATDYVYKVSAFDEDGNESALSADAPVTTLAAPANASAASGHGLMSNFAITPDANSAIVSFTTQTPVMAKVFWGTDGSYSAGSVSDSAPTLMHSLLVSNLLPGERYFVKLSLTDASGEINFENISFVTLKVSNTVAPPDVTRFLAKGSEKSIALTWTNPNDPKMIGVKILRSEIFYPGEPTDGVVVFSGRADHYTDTAVVAGKTYYYTAFSTDQAGNFSSGSLASARLVAAGETVTPVKPLEHLPQAGHVDPLVNALTLKDFLFIQNGDSVPVTDTLSLDGRTATTVALKYYRVPEVLKTIAVTLSTTGENPEYFTFVLKANRDKTRYEATIGPLGDTRDYAVRITILDFENQSLKTIDGTAHVIQASAALPVPVTVPQANPLAERATSLWLLGLLGIVLGLFFILKGKLLRPAVVAAGALIMLLAIMPGFAHAAINPQVNYQGRLVDGSNVAVTNGTYNMRFSLYTAPSGGSSIWTETRTTTDKVAVTSGLFSVMLGSVNSFAGVNFNQPLYLGVEIGGTAVSPTWDGEMTPRKIIGAVPAAFVADTLDGLDSTQFVRSDADTTTNANLTVNGILAVTTGTGNWTGTLSGQTGAYYLANSFSTTSANAFLATKTSDNLTEGVTNQYFTQGHFDTALEATTTLNNLAVLKGITDFIATRSTTTNATSTNFFATTASTTSFFGAGLTTCNTAGSNALTWNNGKFGCNTITGSGGSAFGQAFEVNSAGYLAPTTTITTLLSGGFISQASSTLVGNFTITGNSTTTNATSTNFFATTASSTNLFATSATLGNISAGAVTSGTINGQTISNAANFTGSLTATAGLTSLSNLLLSGSTTLQNLTFVNATSSAATTTSLAITSLASKILKTNANGSIIAAIAGTDYIANTSGDWTGTFDGQEGAYYLANSFSTTSADYWKSANNFFSTTSVNYWKSVTDLFSTTSANAFLATKTSDNLTEGVTNQYFTQGHFDTALEATTTLNNLAVLKGITDFIATRGTTTNATSTNFFATTASSTNLFATNGTVGNLTAGAVTATTFSGAGLATCNGTANALIWNNGLFNCNTITTSGGSGTDVNWNFFNNSGIRVATTSNQVLIGAGATSTLSKLEVVGGFSFDNATGSQATTTSLAILNIVSKLLKTNGNGSVVGAVANTDYQSPVTLTTTGSSGAATFNGTTLNIPNYGAGSYSSTTLLGDNNTFSGTNTFSNPITGSITGNAGTATALQNARTINGVSFNGTANITLNAASSTLLADTNSFSALNTFANLLASGSTTLQNFTALNSTSTNATTTSFFATTASTTNFFGAGLSTCNSVGSALTYNGLGKFGCAAISSASTTLLADNNTFSGNNTFSNPIAGSITGNAGTATALQNARTINGTSFNGTANITITAASSTLLADVNSFSALNTFANLLVSGSSTLQNFTFLNATGSSATTTNFFATTASSTSLFATSGNVGGLTAGVLTSGLINGQTISSAANFTGSLTATAGLTSLSNLLLSGSTTLQNFTFVNATGTSATTTNLFATTASTTSFFGAGLITCQTGNVLTYNGTGRFGCAADQFGIPNSKFATTSGSFLAITPNGGINTGLGIGTTTPAWALQIASSTRPQLALSDGAGADHWTLRNAGGVLYFATASPSTFATSSVSALTINSNSFVGIGGTNPVSKLDVRGDINLGVNSDGLGYTIGKIASGFGIEFNDTNTLLLGSFTATNLFNINSSDGLAITEKSGSNHLQIFSNAANTFAFGVDNGNPSMYLDAAAGRLGIGTSTPHWVLDVASSSAAQLALSDGSLTSNHWTLRNAGGQLYFATASPSTFGTSTKSALTIDANGQLTLPFYGGATGCAQFSSAGVLSNTGTACGTGGGGGTNTDKFATSTNGLAIYPNAATALVVGGTATTTTGAAVEVQGQLYVSASSTLQNFTFVNGTGTSATTTNFFATTASSSKLFAAQAKIGNNALVVNTAGNVAIGQATPSFKLDVNGDINLGASNSLYTGGIAVLTASSTNSSTILGLLAGSSVTFDGTFNTLIGYQAGSNNGAADHNTAVGYASLANSTGSNNTVVGSQSGNSNTTGGSNSFFGFNAGEFNTTGSQNVLIGYQAGFNNGSATSTVALGYSAASGAANYNAQNFTAIGYQALANIITGANDNAAFGYQAGLNVSSGSKNILLGFQAGTNLTTGSSNILLGYNINAFSASSANTLNIGNAIFGLGISGTGSTLSNALIGIGTTTPNWTFQIASSTPYLAITDTDAAVNRKHVLLSNVDGIFNIGTSSDSLTSTSSAFSLDPGAAAQFGLGTSTPWKTLAVTGTVGLDGLTGSTGAGSLCLSANKEVVYNSASDSCLSSLRSTKHDITSLSMNALDMLDQLKSVSFVYNTGATTTRYGFIADDASAIDSHFGTYDADGKLSGIDDRALLSVAIKGIQELNQKFASSTNADVSGFATGLDAVKSAIGLNLDDVSSGLDIQNNVIIRGGLKIDHIASVGDLVMLDSDVEFIGRPYFNSDTGGLALVEAGKSQVDVTFDKPYLDAPVVSATISLDASTTDSDLGAVLASNPTYVVAHKSGNGFSIILSKPLDKSVTFSWIALAIKDMKIASSASTTQPIWSFSNDTTGSTTPAVTPTPTPVPPTDASTTPPTDTASSTEPVITDGAASTTPPVIASDTSTSTSVNI